MQALIEEVRSPHTPDTLVDHLLRAGEDGVALLQSTVPISPCARFSLVAARPFLKFQSRGFACETWGKNHRMASCHFANPWNRLETLLARYEELEGGNLGYPLGGILGYWGYDLKQSVEPKLRHRAENDLDLPDCRLGFYGSMVVFDHLQDKVLAVATGLQEDGSRDVQQARKDLKFWKECLTLSSAPATIPGNPPDQNRLRTRGFKPAWSSNLSRQDFIESVARAQAYIQRGDIYQVNLSRRISAPAMGTGWAFYRRLAAASPAPFSAYLDAGHFAVISSSPEQFLHMQDRHVVTSPIKGTRPRGRNEAEDKRLAVELQTSAKEMAELVMITDLLRNDLGQICEFGSIHVPTLAALQKFSQVQHLVSSVEGRLKPGKTHLCALCSCFPGGSITGAPKFRAMEIIDELEPVSRGVYCGAIGYLGFNPSSRLSVAIRTAVLTGKQIYFNVGAGIVADSDPEAEFEETASKAAGFLAALESTGDLHESKPIPQARLQ